MPSFLLSSAPEPHHATMPFVQEDNSQSPLQGMLDALNGQHRASEETPSAALTFPLHTRQRKSLSRLVCNIFKIFPV